MPEGNNRTLIENLLGDLVKSGEAARVLYADGARATARKYVADATGDEDRDPVELLEKGEEALRKIGELAAKVVTFMEAPGPVQMVLEKYKADCKKADEAEAKKKEEERKSRTPAVGEVDGSPASGDIPALSVALMAAATPAPGSVAAPPEGGWEELGSLDDDDDADEQDCSEEEEQVVGILGHAAGSAVSTPASAPTEATAPAHSVAATPPPGPAQTVPLPGRSTPVGMPTSGTPRREFEPGPMGEGPAPGSPGLSATDEQRAKTGMLPKVQTGRTITSSNPAPVPTSAANGRTATGSFQSKSNTPRTTP